MKRLFFIALALLLALAAGTATAEEVSVTGHVAEIEKYGHARLDITIADFNGAGFALGDIVTVTAGDFTGDMPYLNGYYVDRGEPMVRAYPGHTNIALCVNYGKFAEAAGVGNQQPGIQQRPGRRPFRRSLCQFPGNQGGQAVPQRLACG